MKKKKDFKIVKWDSDSKDSELHFYKDGAWLLGYNPRFFTKKQIEDLLKTIKNENKN